MSLLRTPEGELSGLSIGAVRGTHITFLLSRAETDRVTQVWYVSPGDMEPPIGTVKWFGRWRKYAFFANPTTVYEEVCMRELAEFCQELTRLHRAKRKVVVH